MLDSLAQFVFPDLCPACDAVCDAPGMCAACAQSLYAVGAACPRCGAPVAGAPVVCARCRGRPPPFRRAWAPWRFGGEVATALRRFKFGASGGAGRRELARPLAGLWAGVWPRCGPDAGGADMIVPMPLHSDRLRERGFGQAQALAEAASRQFDGPCVEAFALIRTRPTEEQTHLGRTARMRNVAGAFWASTRVAGKRVVLVDDVITTGATAAAATRALYAAAAADVTVLALARAEP